MKFGELISFTHKEKGERNIILLEETKERIIGITLPEGEKYLNTKNEILSAFTERMYSQFANDERLMALALDREKNILKPWREYLKVVGSERPSKAAVVQLISKVIVSYEKSKIKIKK